MTTPCSKAGPSRGGPWRRSSPWEVRFSRNWRRLASYSSQVMYPEWASRMRNGHSSWETSVVESDPRGTFAGMRAPIAESAGIAGIAQDLAGRVVDQRRPMDLPFMGSGANMARKEQPLGAKEPHRPPGRSNAFERREQETKSLLDLGVRVQDHRAILSVGQANRQRHLQGATLRLMENPTSQARLEHMELGLRHRALQPQQQTAVKSTRIVESIFIQNEGLCHGADFQQMMPVERTAC